jgi:hypothetical protein
MSELPTENRKELILDLSAGAKRTRLLEARHSRLYTDSGGNVDPISLRRQAERVQTGSKSMKINVKQLLMHSDRTSGAVLVILGGFCIVEASQLPFGTVGAPDAGFFPLSLSVMLFSIGAMICAMSFVRTREPVEFGGQAWAVVVTAGAFVLYALCLPAIGYVACTLLILLLLMRGLGGLNWTQSLLIAIPSVALSYLAFVQLGVPLPRGIMPF